MRKQQRYHDGEKKFRGGYDSLKHIIFCCIFNEDYFVHYLFALVFY